MYIKTLYPLPLLAGLIIFLSCIVYLINYFIFHFQGNNFFPENISLLTVNLILLNIGLFLFFGKESKASSCGIELFYFFGIMSVIALASNAIQLTPFSTIDHQLLDFEEYIINLPTVLSWVQKHGFLKNTLGFIYDSLPYQMSILPILIIMSGRIYLLKEYYFLMLLSALIGFTLYYFFPTTAPASILDSRYFSAEQLATGLKFNQIHHYILPSTSEGGLIGFPSFHTIWALLCVYLLKEWRIACIILFSVNTLLITSCVLLGWHYFIDILAGILIVALCYFLLSINQHPL